MNFWEMQFAAQEHLEELKSAARQERLIRQVNPPRAWRGLSQWRQSFAMSRMSGGPACAVNRRKRGLVSYGQVI